MKEQKKGIHHDNRKRNWNVSLSEEEYVLVEKKWKQSGLKKSEYARKALSKAQILSRVEPEDRRQVSRLNRMHDQVNELLKVINTLTKDKNEEGLIKFLYKEREVLDRIEEECAQVALYFGAEI